MNKKGGMGCKTRERHTGKSGSRIGMTRDSIKHDVTDPRFPCVPRERCTALAFAAAKGASSAGLNKQRRQLAGVYVAEGKHRRTYSGHGGLRMQQVRTQVCYLRFFGIQDILYGYLQR